MPFLHELKTETLSQKKEKLSYKDGMRHTIYSTNGEEYTGEWKENLKHGKGTYIYKNGYAYEGDWKCGVRSGFGILLYRSYENDIYQKVYSGAWKNDQMHGYGTYFAKDGEYYEGEWYGGKQSGWGRKYYSDGSTYEGEWYDGNRHGKGSLDIRNSVFKLTNESHLAQENKFVGMWKNDKRHGDGKYYYFKKGKVTKGFWFEGNLKCGQMFDYNRDIAIEPAEYEIPNVEIFKYF